MKKRIYISGIWFIPVLLVLLEASIFLGKANWNSDYLFYFITFWTLRALIAPLIVWYTLRFWVEHTRPFRLLLVHLGGFLLFSMVFWTGAYLVLHNVLFNSEFFGTDRTSTDMRIFGMIVDNSVSTNTIVYASTVGFCYIWEFVKRNISMNKRAMELESSLLTSKLELLKGQLNTHFLFNTLHTISSFVVRKQNDEANKMLIRLSELLRFALKENKDQLIPLRREMQLLDLYLDIQQTRFRDRLQLNKNVPEELQDCLVPSLVLQPIVENAVKYAVEPYSHTGIIGIKAFTVNGSLRFSISDNGKRKFSDIRFDSGIGLTNTKERLVQLFGNNHQFEILPNPSGDGVLVNLSVPLQKNNHAGTESHDSR